MNIEITLPDNSRRGFAAQVPVSEIVASIGSGLARAAVAARLDEELVDLCEPVAKDCRLQVLTIKDPDGLDVVRHSCAHLLGHAVKQLYPQARVSIGPVIENGFYYDIDYEPGFTNEDMARIEQRMRELAATAYKVNREIVSRERARQVFTERDEPYKLEIIDAIPDGERIALYHHQEYIDMCRGPHVPDVGHLRHFCLERLAGAYWRGDSRNNMLQRIYGTAWASAADLKQYRERMEEAARRDHRKLGRRMELFHFQDEAPGMVFWHPDGWQLFRTVRSSIRGLVAANGYQEIQTPQLLDRSLWQRSGHWDKFGEMIFTVESGNREYAMKPMNCPAHVQVFNHELRSYRDLPLRLAEFGVVHRNEPSGTLHGLLRARRFTQDDAHIFCTPEQLHQEIKKFMELTMAVYHGFGFDQVKVLLSTRPANRVGSDQQWDQAEEALRVVLEDSGTGWELNPGEGAFYGPKIEFVLSDSIGRSWQCGTAQVDFSMPERLGAAYIGEDSKKHTPVMVHRAILGSLERFIGILIEHHAGALPYWLAPVQVAVLALTEKERENAAAVARQLAASGVRVVSDLRNEKIGFKIREHSVRRVPYQLIIGAMEVKEDKVAVRCRSNGDLGRMPVSDFVKMTTGEDTITLPGTETSDTTFRREMI